MTTSAMPNPLPVIVSCMSTGIRRAWDLSLVPDIFEEQKLFTHAEHATDIEDTKTSQHRLHGVRLDLKGRE